ncbi:AAA family ATPase [Actinoalloteichus hymeniacidonis]|uniref:Transcriptional regulator, luxR family n=1 Tax=Actinoalloteichus hymeniacidonis TaxID=340345 RepID=A0AAC9MZ67_9PSEU|nr:LuxR family transcriptional regulator [Actinoalloteichus hymeniacidonis]AOS63737.1 transcriptional regulator, luxR family [Actinoalloteichus hymeniacidonis]MBB5908209.1 DNA-binding NarL/FixJ family response regulator [Actinoalloteichus hymeniacidonis]
MRLVERAVELTAITAAFDRCRTSGSEIVVVSGAAGSGRTRLLREVASVVSDSGALVLAAAGSPAETSLAYGVARQLWQSAGIEQELDAYLNQAGPERGARPDERICSELLDRIGDRPTLLCIDDVEHADPMSRGILLHLQRRVGSRHVLVLLLAGESAWTTIPSFDAELHRNLPCQRLRLEPLSHAAVAELLDVPTTSARAAACHYASGGNPLLLGALIADGEHSGADDDGAPPAPAAQFKSAVSACVHRGDEALLAVARCLAVLDRTPSQRLLRRLLRLDAAKVERSVAELTRMGLLDTYGGFRHPEARAALVEATPAAERALLNGRVAELLYSEGADVTAIATHVLLSGELNTAWSAEVMVDAAAEALRSDRSTVAADYADFALRADLEPGLRAAALVTLVRAKWRIAPSAVTSHLPALRTALRAGQLDTRGVESLLSSLLWTGRFDEVLEITRGDVGGEARPACGSGAQAALLWLEFLNPSVLDGTQTDHSPDRHHGDLGMRAMATLVCAVRQKRVTHAAAAADAVLQNCERADPLIETVLAALLTLILVNELDRAENWCERLSSDFRRRGLISLTAVVAAVRADVSLRRGRASVAVREAGMALSMMSRASWGVVIGYPLGTLIAARIDTGMLDEAENLLRRPLPPELLDSTFGLPYRYARGRHALASGRPYAAIEDFRHCGAVMASWGVELSTLVPWRIGLARAYAALARADDARSTLEDQVKQATGRSAFLGAVALRLLSSLDEADQCLPLLQRAVGVLENSGHDREFALALAQLSNEHYARGDSKHSRTVARRAMEVARSCECEAETRELLLGGEQFDVADLLGENDDHYPELTDAEGRVARLAVNGLTNREIGQRLYLSTSTVEQHLTKIFRKFNVTRRTDLIGMLRAEPSNAVPAARLPMSPLTSPQKTPGNPPNNAEYPAAADTINVLLH